MMLCSFYLSSEVGIETIKQKKEMADVLSCAQRAFFVGESYKSFSNETFLNNFDTF